MRCHHGLIVILALPASVHAATITVTTPEDTLANDTACSLREAITAANTDSAFNGCAAGSGSDLILLGANEYRLERSGAGEDANATGDYDIRSSLTIRGAGAGLTRIRGDRNDRLFDLAPGIPAAPVTVTIEGVTLRNGSADQGGAVLVHAGAQLGAHAVSIVNNAAGQGGGIAVFGALVVTSAAFHANAATSGGAIWSEAGASGDLRNVTFEGNTSTLSGSVATFNGVAVLNNVTMTQNVADSDIDDLGDGAIEANALVTLSNSLVARNIDLSLGGSAQLNPDCVVGGTGALVSAGHNLIGNIGSVCAWSGSVGDQVGTPVASINPRLQPFAVYAGTVETMPPLGNSPALESGSAAATGQPGACESVDAAGIPRPQGARCDIGASELDDLVFRDGFDPPLP